jgi:hypothetical protein
VLRGVRAGERPGGPRANLGPMRGRWELRVKSHYAMVGVVIAVGVIVYMILKGPKITAGTPTLSFKPSQPATGGVISNVATAVSDTTSPAQTEEDLESSQWNADY